MLSDAIREHCKLLSEYDMSGVMMPGDAVRAQLEILQAWAAEARNMEERLATVAGREHVPLAIDVLSAPNVILFPPPERPFGEFGGRR